MGFFEKLFGGKKSEPTGPKAPEGEIEVEDSQIESSADIENSEPDYEEEDKTSPGAPSFPGGQEDGEKKDAA